MPAEALRSPPCAKGGQHGKAMQGGDCEAGGMIQLGAVIGCGSTAWPSRHGTGSTAWERRLAVNPSVGVRRQLPLHKGGPVAGRPYFLCFSAYNRPSAGAQYGSSVTLTPPGARKRSGKSRVGTAIFSLVRCPDGHTLFAWVDTTGLRSVAQRGSAVWERRLAAISSYDEITRCQDQKSLYGVFGRLRRSEDSGS